MDLDFDTIAVLELMEKFQIPNKFPMDLSYILKERINPDLLEGELTVEGDDYIVSVKYEDDSILIASFLFSDSKKIFQITVKSDVGYCANTYYRDGGTSIADVWK